MFSHRRFEVSDAAPASKDFPARAVLMSSGAKLFHDGRLYFYPPPSAVSHSEILPRPSYELQSARIDGWMDALLAQRAPMANSPLHLFARRTHPNSIPTAISPEFNARV
jgi:hypothetical protein